MWVLSSSLALAAAGAYSTDVIFTKMALDKMPMYVFLTIICCVYFMMFLGLMLWKGPMIKTYLTNKANLKYVMLAVLGAIVGTMTADILMWSAIKASLKEDLPLTSALIHVAPVMSLLLVLLVYNVRVCWESVFGLVIAVFGIGIMVLYSGYN